jgi:hypothetical protein
MADFDVKWLIERLHERGVARDCELCGEHEWVGLGHEHDHVAFLPARAPDGSFTVTSDLHALVCLNCGNVRLHSLAPLLGDRKTWPKRSDYDS